MAYRSIDLETLNVVVPSYSASSPDKLAELVDWQPIVALLEPLYPVSGGEPAWPPLAMFKALLLAVWYDLSNVKLAETLDDCASIGWSSV